MRFIRSIRLCKSLLPQNENQNKEISAYQPTSTHKIWENNFVPLQGGNTSTGQNIQSQVVNPWYKGLY